MSGIEPVRWYRLADGFLALNTDERAFAQRFHEIHGACATGPPSRDALRFRCRVRTASGRVIADCTPGFPRELLDALLKGRGYVPARGNRRIARYLGPGDWPGVACGDTGLEIVRAGPWQWLLAYLLVSGVLALQPHLLCFHAGAVALDGTGMLLMGPSGAGKTSVTLALVEAGCAFLSDEIGAVRLDSGRLVPVPRAALRRGRGTRRLPVLVPSDRRSDDGVPLRVVVSLRRFAPATRLEPITSPPVMRAISTPLTCSLAGAPGPTLIRWMRILSGVRCFHLDASSPEAAAGAIVAVVGTG